MIMMTGILKSAAGLIAVSTMVLSACTTLDPYTQEEKTSNAAKGAMIGAAAGVAVGLSGLLNPPAKALKASLLMAYLAVAPFAPSNDIVSESL